MGILRLSAVLVFVLASSLAVKEIHASYQLKLVEAPKARPGKSPSPLGEERTEQEEEPTTSALAIEASGEIIGRVSALEQSNLGDEIVVLALHESSQRVFAAKTDAAGRFRMRGLPSGEYRLGVERGADLVEFVGVKVLRGRTTSIHLKLSFE
ncbi:MAG: carboxypeptidase regulatory-like domain-containing protein [Kofleriaceae bacterium]|nr:carboxypeptidase regulatory-like domain-containing protein [Kofleriaceae bacterium]